MLSTESLRTDAQISWRDTNSDDTGVLPKTKRTDPLRSDLQTLSKVSEPPDGETVYHGSNERESEQRSDKKSETMICSGL